MSNAAQWLGVHEDGANGEQAARGSMTVAPSVFAEPASTAGSRLTALLPRNMWSNCAIGRIGGLGARRLQPIARRNEQRQRGRRIA